MAAKNILITGCSSGIGLSAAQELAKRGHRVFATARKPEDVARLRDMGLESGQLDLCDPASIRAAVKTIEVKTGGSIHALVNNAAYGQPGAVEDLSRDALREQFETNLFGTMELTNLVIPLMRAKGDGRVVMVSSVLGLVAAPFRGAYNASKFALEGITDTLRLELKNSGVQVSLVEPGPIATKFRENAYKAFQKHIEPAKSPHHEFYMKWEGRFKKKGPISPFTLQPEAVAAKIIHAIENPRPKRRYYVTLATYGAVWLKRALPFWAMDRVMSREKD
ncbi:MAG: SDR family NAD(P)-dependent oxidoreductase [Nitrospinae bacterium]|nr:SDR family NAD(P)-dependent oxidoreductase [Nitrospinota bacterium]